MAALENMDAAMQATTAAFGQQMNHGNGRNGGNGNQGLMTLVMERELQAQLVPKDQCIEFATYQHTREALHWWQGIRRLLQQGDDPISWDAFQVEFYKKYFPNSVGTAKELELLQLKHGAMVLLETLRSRSALSFKEDSGVISSVGPIEIRTFSELVNKSRVDEECVRKAAMVENDHQEFHHREHN
ncbi:uncharacterized protein LOC130974760 [Arachis stenosperma]|uniref:uncharacterized protein LOC130974760 n=1 Tax=Arachis stenosperma TaxID=217475 RepID=UPI0025ACA250|nr:uncharacterized protein LOC130974760 [Arachis stenosperma]